MLARSWKDVSKKLERCILTRSNNNQEALRSLKKLSLPYAHQSVKIISRKSISRYVFHNQKFNKHKFNPHKFNPSMLS